MRRPVLSLLLLQLGCALKCAAPRRAQRSRAAPVRAAAAAEGAGEAQVEVEVDYDTLVTQGIEKFFLLEAQRGVVQCVIASYTDRFESSEGEAQRDCGRAEQRLRRLFSARLALSAPMARSVACDSKRVKRRAMAYARLASWSGGACDSPVWVRGVSAWAPPADVRDAVNDEAAADDAEDAALQSLAEHLLEKYETAPGLRSALWHNGEDFQQANRVAYRFFTPYLAVAAGMEPVRKALQYAGLFVTKASAKAFSEAADAPKGPLDAWRRAVVASLGAEDWVGDGAALSKLGSAVEEDVEEFFSSDALLWVARHADDLSEPSAVAAALDYFREMRRADSKFSCAGRTPKTAREAIEAFELSTLKFEDDESFLPNNRGLRPMVLTDVTIPKTTVRVPYDDDANGGHGPYKLGPGGLGSQKHSIRVEEVLSLKRLIYEGKALDNCLEDKYSSQVKYVQRARQRVSSFWSFTATSATNPKPQHILLLEVWHLRTGDIVRQAEGPRPRTLPAPEAWYYAGQWCKQNQVDFTTWDHYSQLNAIYPAEPIA
ncbi:hypothetical protein M885DRAFT_623337 [Pelagophyceae sp. CCMP2097]|nr:hypothetical protein M885DRAFT_623337 [Pelagophyceae sp. CCMP2097]